METELFSGREVGPVTFLVLGSWTISLLTSVTPNSSLDFCFCCFFCVDDSLVSASKSLGEVEQRSPAHLLGGGGQGRDRI